MNGGRLRRNPYLLHRQDKQIIHILVCPTTGGRIQLSVSLLDTVDGLKCLLARKLHLQKHKLSLLYKDRYVVQRLSRFCALFVSFVLY